MVVKEKKSYFLYGEGRAPEVLCMGNLVLGSYSNPTITKHHTHRQLSDEELRHNASLTAFKDRVIHAKSGPKYGITLDGAQFVDFDVSWDASHETILTAKAGTRVELKDPEHFLRTEVLRLGGDAEKKLKMWLSAASSEYVLKMKWLRRPTIWMCTGLYLLEGTKVFMVSHKKVSASAGLDSTTMGGLTGIPLGGSITISPETSLEVGSASEDQLVWAAQYRKLTAKYIRLGDGDKEALPGVISLYPDITSEGTLRDESDGANAVQITVGEGGEEGRNDEDRDHMADAEEEGLYYERLAEAIEEFEGYM